MKNKHRDYIKSSRGKGGNPQSSAYDCSSWPDLMVLSDVHKNNPEPRPLAAHPAFKAAERIAAERKGRLFCGGDGASLEG